MWNDITNQSDLEDFMNLFGGFHDSCIKEFKYISGAFVDEDLSMYPTNDMRSLRIIFQRQYDNPAVIEMEFTGLRKLVVCPLDENYTCEILDATMILNDNGVYWYDSYGLTDNDLINYKGTLICSSKVRWRVADEYIGGKEIYTNNLNSN